MSIGFLPYKSRICLSAPLINNNLTDLALFNSSDDFTAKCNGVSPYMSYALTLAPHAAKYYTAFSAPA
jgi:hypothetical protein